jgi:hypothetical protein
MAAYQNVGLMNSPNINNNNNNLQHLSTTVTSDSYDYSSRKYQQQTNSKLSVMPKHHYQNTKTTTTSIQQDVIPSENGANYSTPSDNDSTTNSNETTKRINNTNGKFSIQKMIRQGFSSWRTKRKLSSASTPSAPAMSANLHHLVLII